MNWPKASTSASPSTVHVDEGRGHCPAHQRHQRIAAGFTLHDNCDGPPPNAGSCAKKICRMNSRLSRRRDNTPRRPGPSRRPSTAEAACRGSPFGAPGTRLRASPRTAGSRTPARARRGCPCSKACRASRSRSRQVRVRQHGPRCAEGHVDGPVALPRVEPRVRRCASVCAPNAAMTRRTTRSTGIVPSS